jgi:hypothetical protein
MNHSFERNSDDNFTTHLPLLAKCTKRRVRLSLIEKRKVVETFYLSSHPSIKSFVLEYNQNKTLPFIAKLDASSVAKWLKGRIHAPVENKCLHTSRSSPAPRPTHH